MFNAVVQFFDTEVYIVFANAREYKTKNGSMPQNSVSLKSRQGERLRV